ncbi:SbcC/MukB-like Walker B domain-containing protein [Hymenobacter humi]|uniref:SbcC/MukB-like Walker B domain-containing protein n=1 Tax=Hymenobacter humi TaxID=1411620 RepID=A0ABW2UAM6_9BACT
MAQRLSQQLTQHDQAVAAAQHSLTEVAQQLHAEEGKPLAPSPPKPSPASSRPTASTSRPSTSSLGQRQERLNSHRQGLERHAALASALEQQQQEARRWRGLAEVIGSADGKKFSEFAQGLTLARLVDLANRHLTRLTDRYRILRNPDEHLDLLIVDEYQAGSTRSMNSLSGGESFLVSLALALGLSELAGRKTQIDTLFIDEGFGTLDPDALDVALTALEMLQGTGKTIGIISHVEALKERVSTQISVRKGAGGVSSIRVIGL